MIKKIDFLYYKTFILSCMLFIVLPLITIVLSLLRIMYSLHTNKKLHNVNELSDDESDESVVDIISESETETVSSSEPDSYIESDSYSESESESESETDKVTLLHKIETLNKNIGDNNFELQIYMNKMIYDLEQKINNQELQINEQKLQMQRMNDDMQKMNLQIEDYKQKHIDNENVTKLENVTKKHDAIIYGMLKRQLIPEFCGRFSKCFNTNELLNLWLKFDEFRLVQLYVKFIIDKPTDKLHLYELLKQYSEKLDYNELVEKLDKMIKQNTIIKNHVTETYKMYKKDPQLHIFIKSYMSNELSYLGVKDKANYILQNIINDFDALFPLMR